MYNNYCQLNTFDCTLYIVNIVNILDNYSYYKQTRNMHVIDGAGPTLLFASDISFSTFPTFVLKCIIITPENLVVLGCAWSFAVVRLLDRPAFRRRFAARLAAIRGNSTAIR